VVDFTEGAAFMEAADSTEAVVTDKRPRNQSATLFLRGQALCMTQGEYSRCFRIRSSSFARK
jgi:hypothetical protein